MAATLAPAVKGWSTFRPNHDPNEAEGRAPDVKVRSKIKSARLAHRTEDIESLLRVAIAFTLKAVKAAAIGDKVVTRFNGDPDVPAKFAWPKKGKTPLAFLARYRIAESHALMSPATKTTAKKDKTKTAAKQKPAARK